MQLLSLLYNLYLFFLITETLLVLAKWVRSVPVGGFKPHFKCMTLFCLLPCWLFRWSWFYLFTDEKANLENKFPGKDGTGGLYQGKTPLRKANLHRDVTPLRPGKKEYLRKKLLGRMVEQYIRNPRDLGKLPKWCIPLFLIGEMG